MSLHRLRKSTALVSYLFDMPSEMFKIIMIYHNDMVANTIEMATINGNAERGKAIRSNASQGKARQGKSRQSTAMQGKAMQRKATHGKARQ